MHFSHYFMVDKEFQKKKIHVLFHTFSLHPTYIPAEDWTTVRRGCLVEIACLGWGEGGIPRVVTRPYPAKIVLPLAPSPVCTPTFNTNPPASQPPSTRPLWVAMATGDTIMRNAACQRFPGAGQAFNDSCIPRT